MHSGPDVPRRLDSWKEIAAYLGRDVRTAMRWAKHQGLPVHRIGGRRRGSVYADPLEIDQWLRAGSQVGGNADPAVPGPGTAPVLDIAPGVRRRERRRSWILAAAAAGGVLLAVVLVARYPSASPAIDRAAIVGRDVVAFDARGRELWRSTLARENENLIPNNPRIFRWDADSPSHVLVAVELQRHDGGGSGSLAVLSDTGTLIWSRMLEDRYTFDGIGYGPTWYPNDALPFRANGSSRIAASLHQQTWWPSVVATFDRDGLVVGRFVNTGWIHKLNVSADGRYLLASGMSNMLGGAILAVLDSQHVSGSSPGADGSLPACPECPSGAPIAYFLIPWSDVARAADTPQVVVQVADSGEIELHASQRLPRDGPIPALIVALSPSLDVIRRGASDSFAEVHAQLERQRALDHPFDRCPWRTPPVRKWTAARGWEELR